MNVIVLNTKGGCGKSTIACNLAVEAAAEGNKVLIIDDDVQANTVAFHATRNKKDNITQLCRFLPLP